MANELVRNEWGVILRQEELLELRWLPTPETMSDGGFMATLCLFAWEAEKARPRALLIDAVAFRHSFGPGVMEWRGAPILPPPRAPGGRGIALPSAQRGPRQGEGARRGHDPASPPGVGAPQEGAR